jgi:hypothetical protein
MRPSEEVFLHTGGSTAVAVWVRNLTARTWHRGTDNLHYVDAGGNDLRYPYCGPTPEWVNGTAVLMSQQQVAPGQVALYPVRICGAPNYQGTATVRLQFIQEGVAHTPPVTPLQLRFGPAPPATFVAPTVEGPGRELVVPSGGRRFVDVAVRNNSGRTWLRGIDNLHAVDPSSNDATYPYCGLTKSWVNGTAVLMTKRRVRAGKIAHYRVKICGAAGYEGPASVLLQYVREGVAHYAPLFRLHVRFAAG